jgi:hypothetical protein
MILMQEIWANTFKKLADDRKETTESRGTI